MGKGELHIPLLVTYASDEKLEDVSRDARLLYIDAVCYCKEKLTDGFVSDVQLGKLVSPATPAKGKKWAGELVASGAWERHGKGYVIPAFLKRNPSRAQIMADRAEASDAGVRGNHERWHKDRISPTCPLCPGSEPDDRDEVGSPDTYPIDTRSGFDRVGVGSASPETETETGPEAKNSPNPVPSTGGVCAKHQDKPHPNCRGCKTNARAVRAEAGKRGPWCGQCLEDTRMFEDENGIPERCSCATPTHLRVVSA